MHNEFRISINDSKKSNKQNGWKSRHSNTIVERSLMLQANVY